MMPRFRCTVEEDGVESQVIVRAWSKDEAADVAIQESGADSVVEVEDWGE